VPAGDAPARLAYADPPYPGKAHLYPENEEVDHVALIARLQTYDGWALSTDETNLRYVLGLCPPKVRVLAWCRTSAPPFKPFPYAAWEPVICRPARVAGDAIPSYFAGPAAIGRTQRDGLSGQKTAGFCEWVIRCLGADRGDTMHDVFPGTGIMGEVWERWRVQPPLPLSAPTRASPVSRENQLRRWHPVLPGIEAGRFTPEGTRGKVRLTPPSPAE
jgi:hypothetical protein